MIHEILDPRANYLWLDCPYRINASKSKGYFINL